MRRKAPVQCRECEKQELNLRTPAGTDLESASVGHLDILARDNIGFKIVKGFEIRGVHQKVEEEKISGGNLRPSTT
jgi:hypothetical protein